MYLLVLPVLLGIAAVPLRGGDLSALTDLRFRKVWLLQAALVAQVVVLGLMDGPVTVRHHAIHLGSYALAGAFVLANRSVRFFGVLSTGGGLNVAAIVANGGVMPARPGAMVSAGMRHAADQFANSNVVEGAQLWFLGDVFAIPATWPFSNVFSIGDVVLVFGAIALVHRLCCRRTPRCVRTAPATNRLAVA
ncbi:MAG: DUF5317 domain-containing protein [Egibacteraceae bacterium]